MRNGMFHNTQLGFYRHLVVERQYGKIVTRNGKGEVPAPFVLCVTQLRILELFSGQAGLVIFIY